MKNKIDVPTMQYVGPETQVLFERIKHSAGKVPNLYATIGYSANALKGFLDFEEALNEGMFTPKEREAIALVVSQINDCKYCLAAHTALAIKRGFSNEGTVLIRKGLAKDMKLNSLIQLAKSIAVNKGNADPLLLTNFLAEGYPLSALIELTGLVAVRIFTNYVYKLTDIPLDFQPADPLN